MKSKRKITENDLIWAIEASRILGVSRPTFDKRFLHDVYGDIRVVLMPKGKKFCIFDVFKVAHPRASDDQIERFIREFRNNKRNKNYGKAREGK